MYSIGHLTQLRILTSRYRLENREILSKYSDEDLSGIYNGIGPDAFPMRLRLMLTTLHRALAPAVLIHDVEWHEADGTRASFDASNLRFKRNGYAIARKKYSHWNPHRYLVMNEARTFANICQRFGWHVWLVK